MNSTVYIASNKSNVQGGDVFRVENAQFKTIAGGFRSFLAAYDYAEALGFKPREIVNRAFVVL